MLWDSREKAPGPRPYIRYDPPIASTEKFRSYKKKFSKAVPAVAPMRESGLTAEDRKRLDVLFERYHSMKDFSVDSMQVCFDIGWLMGLVANLDTELSQAIVNNIIKDRISESEQN